MKMWALFVKVLTVSSLSLWAAAEQSTSSSSSSSRVRKLRSTSGGFCRYGLRVDCCWGWNRRSWGHCQPFIPLMQRICRVTYPLKAVCQHGCKHGECVGPNKCKCYPGYTGKTCNQDLNECGLKPRPCKHRCMNTYGSYKCYCLNGYMLMPDGSCANTMSCLMANCQYGCDEVKGEIRCRCPSTGLKLGPDRRTCVDVDECATGRVMCPRLRKCINTFGSYFCKCHDGFELRYFNGKYRCVDIDECSRRTHKCSAFAACQNTPGSYKCKCFSGYKGSGYTCTYDPRTNKFPYLPPGNGRNETNGGMNSIPNDNNGNVRTIAPPRITVTPQHIPRTPEVRPAPTTARITTTAGATTTISTTTAFTPAVPSTTVKSVDNRIHNEVPPQRGDVFIPRQPGGNGALIGLLDIEKGITAEENDARDDQDILVSSCNFDHGMCGWTQEKRADLHWERVLSPLGRSWYLALSESNTKKRDVAHLILPLALRADTDNLCLTFRHKLSGDSLGKIQVFMRRNSVYGQALWQRNRGYGWRTSRFTLKGPGIEHVIFKGVRETERSGEIALDDISLQRGHCSGKQQGLW
ncbi:nephronectin a isoform X1 [Callorhinchus milii]|uniref:nephronectin a isoform X1 n=1 Tax=Callorhinchus milii TaxID=7868 RepID=UPI001C3FD59C|nr:nephronectin a isoform X1 [Callorhinchus milii]